MQRLTKEQAIVLTGFTGITCCEFYDFQCDVEKRLGEPITTIAFSMESFNKKVKELYREDFMKLVHEETEKCD